MTVEAQRETTPVFSDESGTRAAVLQWLARGICASFVLVSGAVAFTLATDVPLPGLGGLVAPRTDDSTPRTTSPRAPVDERSDDLVTAMLDNDSTSSSDDPAPSRAAARTLGPAAPDAATPLPARARPEQQPSRAGQEIQPNQAAGPAPTPAPTQPAPAADPADPRVTAKSDNAQAGNASPTPRAADPSPRPRGQARGLDDEPAPGHTRGSE